MIFVDELACGAVGNNQTYSQCLVTELLGKAEDGRGFHLEVGHRNAFPTEGGQSFVEIRHCRGKTDVATLGAVETGGGGGDALRQVAGDAVQHLGAALYGIGCGVVRRQSHVLYKGLLHLGFEEVGVGLIVVHQTVKSYGVVRGHQGAAIQLGLQRSAGADAQYSKLAMAGAGASCAKVEVGGHLQLVHHDVDVVASHPRGDDREAGAFAEGGHHMDLSRACLIFDGVEKGLDQINTFGVAHQYHVVCQGVVADGHMVGGGAAGGKYKFGFFH